MKRGGNEKAIEKNDKGGEIGRADNGKKRKGNEGKQNTIKCSIHETGKQINEYSHTKRNN